MEFLFFILKYVELVVWEYCGIIAILFIGLALTIKSKFLQIKTIRHPLKNIKSIFDHDTIDPDNQEKSNDDHQIDSSSHKIGIEPWKLYFSSMGGMIGIGSLITIMSAVILGGPGSIMWMWIASFLGMIVKYAEIYLGVKYRMKRADGSGYDGGPMYYISVAFQKYKYISKYIPILLAILLAIYGVEVVQFLVIVDTVSEVTSINKVTIVAILLALVMGSALGGVKRLSNVCSSIMPPLLISYFAIGVYIIGYNFSSLPTLFKEICYEAFKFYDPEKGAWNIGGIILAAHYGFSRAVYSGDVGIGYDSIVQSEGRIKSPSSYSRIAFFSLFSDTVVSTISILIAMTSGAFKVKGLEGVDLLSYSLSKYLPIELVKIYVTIIIVIAGFSTIIGYFVIGQKAVSYINIPFGRQIYICYAVLAFIIFSFQGQDDVMLIMSVSGGILMLINLIGIYCLRKEIKFWKDS